MKVGIGYDAHRLTEGRQLILGGVSIDYSKGLLAHSDGDVLIHAIIDALLGAAGLGDIGRHFPDSDERFCGISSVLLLEETARRISEAGYTIGNIDATIIAQKPRLSEYVPQMESNICAALRIGGGVNVKATTEEGMGFTGSGEGISAQAICLLLNREVKPLDATRRYI